MQIKIYLNLLKEVIFSERRPELKAKSLMVTEKLEF